MSKFTRGSENFVPSMVIVDGHRYYLEDDSKLKDTRNIYLEKAGWEFGGLYWSVDGCEGMDEWDAIKIQEQVDRGEKR